MNDTMYHRGPNDSGIAIYEGSDGYSIGLAHRRLSILDLSPLGHQPMHSANGRVSIVFNGEIYNFLELKEELKDYPYKSTCDTEVILAAYMKWGINMVDHISGMFAIALYDRETQDVFLKNQKKKSHEYAIKITNKSSESIKVLLKDTIPASTDKTITVDATELSGGVINEENGVIDWEVEVAGKSSEEIKLAYTITWPKDKQINRSTDYVPVAGSKKCPSCGASVTGKFCPVCGALAK